MKIDASELQVGGNKKPTFDDIDLSPSVSARRTSSSAPALASDRVLTRATTDSELAKEFLAFSALAPKSLANTQKELFRFLTWCREERMLSLNELLPDDLMQYMEFLKSPPESWVSTRKFPRSDERYRPLSGPLSDASRRQSMVAVKGLLSFAAGRKYIPLDIGSLVKNVKRSPATSERYLSEQEIQFAVSTIENRVCGTDWLKLRRERDRFLLIAFYYSGARLSELADAQMSAFALKDGRWRLSVLGKGNKPRNLNVHPDLLLAYTRYRVAFGLPPYPPKEESLPLVLSIRRGDLKKITDESVAASLQRVFTEAAKLAETSTEPISAAQFSLATTHWLRHSMLSHNANNGVQLKTLQDEAGHANIATTSRYLHKDEEERHAELIAAKDKQKNRMRSSA